ncbi:MAG: hypothetical protein ACKOXC_04680 [Aquirufa sp.]
MPKPRTALSEEPNASTFKASSTPPNSRDKTPASCWTANTGTFPSLEI